MRINNKAFTLIELLAVIVILAIVLAIAIPSISSVIDNSEKSSFVSSTKLLINAVKIKLLEDETFDITTINKSNLKSILNIDDENYSSISFRYDINGKIYANIEGQGKWANLVTCGNYENISTIDTDCIIKDGLVMHLDASNQSSYPGSGTTWYDLSGNSNNGTLTNGPTYNSANGGSIVFDGSNDYVRIQDSVSTNFGTGSYTIGIWVKPANTISNWRGIVSKRTNSNYKGWAIFETPTNKFGVQLASNHSGPYYSATSLNSFVANNWYYINAVIDRGNKQLRFYVNGIQQGNAVDITNLGNTNNITPLLIGHEIGINTFPGSISNGHIYNRALSVDEIQQNYNALKYRYGL